MKISRRSFLHGAAGVMVGLPSLQIMFNSRSAAAAGPAIPKRYVVSFVGVTTTNDSTVATNYLVPTNTGHGYTAPRALQPLVTANIKDQVSVVSGLKVPWDTGGGVPAGGRSTPFHYNTMGPQVCGKRGGTGRNATPTGATSDQIVADAIAGTTPQRALHYRVQPISYEGGGDQLGNGGRMSSRLVNGNLVSVEPIASPKLAYQSLFSGFQAPMTDPTVAAKAAAVLAARKSVLDLVSADANALMARLGAADRIRMQQHFDQIRDLETRLSATLTPTGTSCKLLPDPGADPAIGSDTIGSYSNEDHRAGLMTDFIAMAFACDMSRVSSLMFTPWKCYMGAYPITQYHTDVHSMTHGATPDTGLADALGFYVKHFGLLASKLKAIPEPDGTTVLDNSAMVLLFEGGHGADPESGGISCHSTENMVALIAGSAGGLKPGQHLVATGMHPANVVISAMKGVGVNNNNYSLGEVTGALPGLFT